MPGVSYVMPVLNEARYVQRAVESVQRQEYPGPTEILIVLGRSTDGTDEIVGRLAAADSRIRLIANPRNDVPSGLNRAMRSATQPTIVRVDAHSEIPPGYTRRAVQTLIETGAANVGGVMDARGDAGLQAAVARAYNSRWGLGGGAYHNPHAPAGPAESAYLGVMRLDALRDVGYLDPSLRRGQDWELNHRLRKAGYRVWLDPALRVGYWPRSSLAALWRQMHTTGIWRGEIVRRLPTGNSPRYFAPPMLVLATALAVLLLPFAARDGVGQAATAVALMPVTYLALLALIACRTAGRAAERLRFVMVLAVIHFAWGIGFVRGVLQGARDATDTSRLTVVAAVPRPQLQVFAEAHLAVDADLVGVGES